MRISQITISELILHRQSQLTFGMLKETQLWILYISSTLRCQLWFALKKDKDIQFYTVNTLDADSLSVGGDQYKNNCH